MLLVKRISKVVLISGACFISMPVFSADLNKRVEILERRIGALSDLMMQIEALKADNSRLRGQLEEQNYQLDNLKKRQRDLYIDIDSRLSAMQSTTKAPVAPVTALTEKPLPKPVEAVASLAPQTPASPVYQVVEQKASSAVSQQEQADYDAAYKLLSPSQKRYGDAIVALDKFLKDYPVSALADNAQYWLAEAYYVSRKNDEALQEFEKVIARYPDSPKVSAAMLKIGYLQHAKGNSDEARQMLEKVIADYPNTPAANMAKNRLQRIK